MDGAVFLWCFWIMLIMLVFFFHKKISAFFSYHLLIVIFLSQFFIPYQNMELNAAFIYVLLIAFYFTGILSLKSFIRVLSASIITALARGSFYLYLTLEPLWLSWVPQWLLIAALLYMVLILVGRFTERALAHVLACVFSDVLLLFAFKETWVYYAPFSLSLLDFMSAGLLVLVVWSLLEQAMKQVFESTISYKKEV
ncbi:MAG: hypothetical protein ACI4XL_06955 [Bacillus sp. (in: firmicutes)]